MSARISQRNAYKSPTKVKKGESIAVVTPSDSSPVLEKKELRATSPVSKIAICDEDSPSSSKSLKENDPVINKKSKTPQVTPTKQRKESTKVMESKVDKIELNEEIVEDKVNVEKTDESKAFVSKIVIHPRVNKVYKVIRKCTGSLGGNGYDGAIYGELTMHSMQKVLDILIEKCNLTSQSRFIDIGAGLGKPNFHAAQYPGVRVSFGVELEEIRWKLSIHNLTNVLAESVDPTETDLTLKENEGSLYGGSTNFIVNDIDNAITTDPFTHIYQFDLGFPPPLQQNIAKKFNESHYAQYLISYRPPHRVIHEYGYNVEKVDQILTSMFGSGEGHTAYIYKRIQSSPRTRTPTKKQQIKTTLPQMTLPARLGFDEDDETVYCDPIFYEAIKDSVDKAEIYHNKINTLFLSHIQSGRPVRSRRNSRRIAEDGFK